MFLYVFRDHQDHLECGDQEDLLERGYDKFIPISIDLDPE
jgi:hypothetical protein